MVDRDSVGSFAREFISGNLSRRQIIKGAAALGLVGSTLGRQATSMAGAAPDVVERAAGPLAQLKEVPREKTMIAVRGGVQGKFVEDQIWNPFLPAGNHQFALMMVYEPLAFYSAFVDKTTMWLAESREYSPDYKTLTVKTRPNITWSDGKPFSADDVAYTFNSLVEVGSKVKWGADVQQFLDKAEATDPNTTVFHFKVPAPRFFDFVAYKFDIGVYIAPKHIFEGQDWATFTHWDLAKGWPVTTAPWRVVYSAPEQKVLDRADSWWGVDAKVAALPEPERFILLPDPGEQGLVTGVIANQYDIDTGIQPTSFATVFSGNPKVTTWTGQDSPYGNVDWWPHSLYVNNEKAPWSDKDVRWALSSYLDRDQIIDVAWSGASLPSTLFLPDYPGLKPFMDAAKPLIDKYPYLEFNPQKGDQLLTAKGWKKDGSGMWQDETGKPVQLEIISFFDFTSVGPVVVEQLKRAGIDATYSEPPNFSNRFSAGDYTGALFGHGGSYSSDIYYSLRLYQTGSEKIPGGHLVNFSLWHNKDYDKLVDELYGISPTEMDKVLDIWNKCMAIWLPEYPDIQISQGLHRLPMNTTYWTNWPNAENPYINPAHYHLTWPLVMHAVKAAQ
jgi:peptide/nickel transport system substrate-binding protein